MSDITIKDVARVAKVSVGTASMALNGKKGVSSRTCKKVLAVAEKLNYTPNRYARSLSSRQSRTIGLIVTDITNPYFGLIIDLIQQNLELFGYDLMMNISGDDAGKERHAVEKYIDINVDGVIAVPSQLPSSDVRHFEKLKKRGIPLCFISINNDNVHAPCVMTDLGAGAYVLTNHLLDTGRERILYVLPPMDIPAARLRVEGYRSAFQHHSKPFVPEWIVCVDDATFDCSYHVVEDVLGRHSPDAIMAMNDLMALGILKRLKEMGRRVPKDVAVAGYDDMVYAPFLETPLTSVGHPVEEMCKQAVEITLRQITGETVPNTKILLPPKLIVRTSTIRAEIR